MNVNELIRTRPDESYTRQEKQEISLLSLSEEATAIPFGSATYVIQKYPGDLDLYETFIDDGPPKKAIKNIKKRFQKVVMKSIDKPCHWISDIKAGVDYRFDLSIGTLSNGIWDKNNANLLFFLENTKKKDQNQMEDILNSMSSDQTKFDLITKIVREYKIIRWTAKEVIKGKIYKNGKEFSLTKALNGSSQVKIDSITYMNNRFVEVTNMMYLATMYQGKIHIINTSYDFTDMTQVLESYDKSLKDEIEKLFYSDVWYNPFKGAKRMWAFARTFNKQYGHYLPRLTPVISGNISLLYQIKSEIATIDLAENSPYSEHSKECITRHLPSRFADWKLSISRCPLLDPKMMVSLFNIIDNRNKDLLEEALKKIINVNTIKELKSINMYPIPDCFLPVHRNYKRPL